MGCRTRSLAGLIAGVLVMLLITGCNHTSSPATSSSGLAGPQVAALDSFIICNYTKRTSTTTPFVQIEGITLDVDLTRSTGSGTAELRTVELFSTSVNQPPISNSQSATFSIPAMFGWRTTNIVATIRGKIMPGSIAFSSSFNTSVVDNTPLHPPALRPHISWMQIDISGVANNSPQATVAVRSGAPVTMPATTVTPMQFNRK